MTYQENERTRFETRTRVLLSATLFSAAGPQKVLVRDLSADGAQIYSERLSEGDVSFRCGGLFVAAQITWRRRGVGGLSFYRRVSAAELESAFPSALTEAAEQSSPHS